MPERIHIVGRKNSGKTTLVVELVQRLAEMGLVVGTIKHTHHRHELDTPGKDSHRHREAGARVVGILSGGLDAVFYPSTDETPKAMRYERVMANYSDCDVVLVEGDSQTDALKVEVWRAVNGTEPLAASDSKLSLVVTDDPLEVAVPVLPRSRPEALCEWIQRQLKGFRGD